MKNHKPAVRLKKPGPLVIKGWHIEESGRFASINNMMSTPSSADLRRIAEWFTSVAEWQESREKK